MWSGLKNHLILPGVLLLFSLYFVGFSVWENRDEPIQAPEIPEAMLQQAEDVQTEQEPKAQGKLNINTASKNELMELDGIGETLAERIVEMREKLGGFRSINQLLEIKGIGEKTFDKFKDFITTE